MPTSKNLDSLVINRVESQEVYEWMKANNKTNEDELYLTPDNTGSALPVVSTSDNGKFLQVVNGAWSAVSIPSGEGVNF